jgi:hypothetical protein
MPFNVNEFRSQLRFDGARPNMFLVRFLNVGDVRFDRRTEFFVNAAEIPSATLGVIELPYFGRRVPIPGDRSFQPWTVQVLNDEDFAIRASLENWSNSMNSLTGNIRLRRQYLSDAEVVQFSKYGTELRTYKFRNIFPADVSAIPLNWGSTDSVEEFTVTFRYDNWEVTNSLAPAGDAEGAIPGGIQ